MLKKILFLLILVIVLVSLNWFQVVLAQSLDDLTDDEKLQLLQKRSRPAGGAAETQYYQSPDFFDADTSLNVADSSWKKGGKPKPAETNSTKSTITPFEELRPFGMDLFDGPRDIDPAIDVASAQDYILGPADNVIIYLWGRVERQYNLTLDREGKVFIPRVGEIVGWGLTLEKFTNHLEKRFATAYSEFDITVSLGRIRSIRVYLTGEIKSPGAYSVSSLTSLFNAIYTAGGPNERGSMRNIRLLRQGVVKAEIDLYDFLLAGDNKADFRLQTGDVIFVPVAGPRVAIRGEINRPAIYELKGNQTASELLALAGSTTAMAHLDRIMLERVGGKKEWEVLDLDLNPQDASANNDVNLIDGDRITVYSIFEAKTNMVALFGQVKHPGYYERDEATCVSDLINQGQLQPYDVYMDRANLFRRHPDWRTEVIPIDLKRIVEGNADADMLLSDRDSLHVYSIEAIERDRHVYIEGEINSPGRYPLYDKMTAADLIFLAGSYTQGANRHRLEIASIDSVGKVSLMNVEADDKLAVATILREDDHVYVRRIPQWEKDRAVTLRGEVMYPGAYTLASRGETFYQLLQRAGGFTGNAFPRGTVFKRQSIQESLNHTGITQVVKNTRPIVQDSLGNFRRDGVFNVDMAAMNRIIVDVKTIMATQGREGDLILHPGDSITVPPIPSGISILGAVAANGTLKFSSDKSVRNYIKRAGGFSRQADKSNTRLIAATGEVYSNGGVMGRKVRVGDVIVVPTRIEKESNWLKSVTSILTATTGVLTSIYIISRI